MSVDARGTQSLVINFLCVGEWIFVRSVPLQPLPAENIFARHSSGGPGHQNSIAFLKLKMMIKLPGPDSQLEINGGLYHLKS